MTDNICERTLGITAVETAAPTFEGLLAVILGNLSVNTVTINTLLECPEMLLLPREERKIQFNRQGYILYRANPHRLEASYG